MADDFPIDINYAKVAEWLVDRKLLQRDWRPRLAAIQEQALKAAQELSPEHARLLLRAPWEEEGEDNESPSISSIDHPTTLRVRAALVSDPETAKKSLLGAWQGPAGTWDKLCRAYSRGGSGSAAGSLPVAEAALALCKLVDFEVPALRASTARGHQTLRDLERRASECAKQAATAAKEYEAECSGLGISPRGGGGGEGSVEGELKALVARELGPLLRSAVEVLRSEEVGIAVGYYADFVGYAHAAGRKGGAEAEADADAEPLLPALAAVRAASASELEDQVVSAVPASASESDAATGTEISWDIDVSSSGAEAESSGAGEEAASGGISWEVEVEDDDNSENTTSSSALPASKGPPETPPDLLSRLASDASTRSSLGDDLAELSAFLNQRLAAVRLSGGGCGAGGMTTADLPRDSPSSLAVPEPALQSALAALRAAETSLSGERASMLLLLGQPGGKGARRIAARLRARAGAEGKFKRAAAAASARASAVRAELAADAKALRRAAAATRDAKKRAEEGIAAILGGNRKINVVGEVSSVLAAAERG